MTRLASPGAMPMACVISSVCSVSSQLRRPACLAARARSVSGEESDGDVVGLADILEIGGQVGKIRAQYSNKPRFWPAPVRLPLP